MAAVTSKFNAKAKEVHEEHGENNAQRSNEMMKTSEAMKDEYESMKGPGSTARKAAFALKWAEFWIGTSITRAEVADGEARPAKRAIRFSFPRVQRRH